MSGTGGANLMAGSTFTLSGTADLGGRTLNLAGTLSGSGTIIGTVVNSGQIELTSLLTIQGNYTQTAQGTLNIAIGGTTAGTDYGQLNVTGLATLNGTLNVALTNGYLPNAGDSFQVLLFGSVSGDFATENGLNLGNGLQLDPEYSAGGLTLVTIAGTPPPGGGASSPRSPTPRSWTRWLSGACRGIPTAALLGKELLLPKTGNWPATTLISSSSFWPKRGPCRQPP